MRDSPCRPTSLDKTPRETAPSVVKTYISSACNATNAADEYESVSTANEFSEGVGWFYYSQTNPCNTYFGGLTDTALGLTSMTSLGAIAGPFPTLRSRVAFGMGDYSMLIRLLDNGTRVHSLNA